MRKTSRKKSKLINSNKRYVACPLCIEYMLFASLKKHINKFHPESSYNEAIKKNSLEIIKPEERNFSEKVKIHISDSTASLAHDKQMSIKAFAEKYGWKGNVDIVLSRLKSLGFIFATQLDIITVEAKEAFAKSLGYKDFKSFSQTNHIKPPQPIMKLAGVAQKLNIDQNTLFNRLIYEYAKQQCCQIIYPVYLVKLSSACHLPDEIVIRCIKSGNKELSLNAFSIIEESDRDIFLASLSKLNFKTPKTIPDHLETIAKLLIEEKERLYNIKILKDAKSDETYTHSVLKKYQNLKLDELGKLYQNGNNLELDDTENDVIKKLINKKLQS